MEGLQKHLFLIPAEDGTFSAKLLLRRPIAEPPDLGECEWIVDTPNSPVRLAAESVNRMSEMYVSVKLICANRADTARLLLAARCAGGEFHPRTVHIKWGRDREEHVYTQLTREGCSHIYERTESP